jgi:uncharacterized protein (DUF305 family)
MVTSMQRPTEPRTSSRWKIISAVLAVIALGSLIWAFTVQSRMNEMHSSMMGSQGAVNSGMQGHEMSGMGQMSGNLGPADAEYDKRFIDAMIPHHESAVDMAKDAQQKSQRSEIKQLAQAIIDAQTSEINQLKQWRDSWY